MKNVDHGQELACIEAIAKPGVMDAVVSGNHPFLAERQPPTYGVRRQNPARRDGDGALDREDQWPAKPLNAPTQSGVAATLCHRTPQAPRAYFMAIVVG